MTTSINTNILDERALDTFITAAALAYETSAPAVVTWLEDLYQRILNTPERVTLLELRCLQQLREEGQWMQANHAANIIYKLLDELGQDTTGLLGF